MVFPLCSALLNSITGDLYLDCDEGLSRKIRIKLHLWRLERSSMVVA